MCYEYFKIMIGHLRRVWFYWTWINKGRKLWIIINFPKLEEFLEKRERHGVVEDPRAVVRLKKWEHDWVEKDPRRVKFPKKIL